jgi:hypothetical protein
MTDRSLTRRVFQVTSYVLLPFALLQFRGMPAADRQRLFASSANNNNNNNDSASPPSSVAATPLLIMAASGACLAVRTEPLAHTFPLVNLRNSGPSSGSMSGFN